MEMVGVMGTSRLREEAVSYLNDAKMHTDTSAKTSMLKRLKEILLHREPSLLHEFVPHLMELQTERSGPVRNYLVQMIQEIGLKYSEHIPAMVPALLALMQDDTPAVARHAISTGSSLFRSTFEQVALQGIYSGHVDSKLQESWSLMTALKDALYLASREHKNDGVRLLAIKFIEMVILLFTPEPNGSTQPPPLPQKSDKTVFNVAWLHGGHPVLDVGSLGQEASRNLSLLLDQLRGSEVLKIPGPVAVVLVNSLASIAKQRPSLYGRVLPVLLGLVPNCEAMKGTHLASVAQALKNAFVTLLKCTHSGAGPWRERIVSALRVMKDGDAAEAVVSQQTKVERVHSVDRNWPIQENGIMDEPPGKRMRTSVSVLQTGLREGQLDVTLEEILGSLNSDLSSSKPSSLQKLVSAIGSVVAKGEQGNKSVDFIIETLPAEVLADVVIENMKNLPHVPPAVSPSARSETIPGFSFNFGMPFGTVGALGQALAASFTAPATPETTAPNPASDHRRDPRRDPRRLDPRHEGLLAAEVKLEDSGLDMHNSSTSSAMPATDQSFSIPSSNEQISFIPGISHTGANKEASPLITSSLVTDVVMPSTKNSEASSQIQSLAISLDTKPMPSKPLPASDPAHTTVETSDAISISDVKPVIVGLGERTVGTASGTESKKEVLSVVSLGVTAQSVGVTAQSASTLMPVIPLDTSQQLALWNLLLVRILGSDKQVGSSGGSELRLSILARFLLGSDPGDEAWSVLLQHILADYQNHRGHELVIHTLYHLYTEQLSHTDNFYGGPIPSLAYDKFFISVAEGLRDALPPTDKSLSKLLGEAPTLPEAALKLLEALCSPSIEIKEGLEAPVVERITQGLSAVWSLILLRPPIRSECLEIALKCTVHELEEVRTKAIRLVANKLYPLSYLSQSIEEYAMKMLHIVLEMGTGNLNGTKDLAGEEGFLLQDPQSEQGTGKGVKGKQANCDNMAMGDSGLEDDEQKNKQNLVSIQEAQRCMSLYFALCTKKHSLLQEIFNIYERAPRSVKQAVHKHMPILTRTIGSSSSDVLQIISNPPPGSKSLVLLVLHVLTELATPSPELIAAVKQLYETKIKDAKLLTPILSSLSKEEVLPIFPHLVALPAQDFKGALDRILQGSVHSGPALTPAEVLIAIHGIDPQRDHVPLSMVKDACAVCFQQRTVFTQQVLAKVLNQLVEQTPLPMLFMRTVIQAVGSFRSLVSFVMEILSRLVSKQIWKWPNLWIGFLKCAEQTQPHSFHVLLQLPALQLKNALQRHPKMRVPLTKHASKPGVRSTLPRSTLLVLELTQDVLPPEASTAAQSMPGTVSASGTSADAESPASEPAKTS